MVSIRLGLRSVIAWNWVLFNSTTYGFAPSTKTGPSFSASWSNQFSFRLRSAQEHCDKETVTSEAIAPMSLTTIPNFRPIVPRLAGPSGGMKDYSANFDHVCRSAALDELSIKDAESLIVDQGFFSAILDLRNQDEIKTERRSEGSTLFYDWLETNADVRSTQLVNIPVLQDVNRFWDITIEQQLTPLERAQATAQSIWQAGALDRAAARSLEAQQHIGLYKSMLQSGGSQFGRALDMILLLVETDERPILLHCQKGKDRTGLLAMMLQHCVTRDEKNSIIESYRLSEVLLGETELSKGKGKRAKNSSSGSGSQLDWSRFRGSPAAAMEQTLDWIDASYGSMDGYLDMIGFAEEKRKRLRNACRR
mmetsp:Transcript_8909/g.24689  ORF Transcript_8909/g.24689 Transcript_8909/m.24689 type:complete len:365 (+) Transcript_8909:77-1171(+)